MFFFAMKAIAAFVIVSCVTVVAYKWIAPPITPLMILRPIEGMFDGRSVGIEKTWVSYEEISPYLFKAILSGEDRKFMTHDGFDWQAIESAKKYNERNAGKKVRGASTVSMQTAKNAFLWHGRNYVRKAMEAYFTVLIEAVWGKKRILEVYANIVEWGDGVYGVEAASRKYFGKSARDLSKKEASLLAAVLPNPRRWSPAEPTAYIQKRSGFIMGRMSGIAVPK